MDAPNPYLLLLAGLTLGTILSALLGLITFPD